MTAIQVLKKARKLLSNKKRWTQDAYARNRWGHEVAEDGRGAVKFCSLGAIYRVAGENDYARIQAIGRLNNVIGGSIASFNDNRGHSEVLRAFDLAIKGTNL